MKTLGWIGALTLLVAGSAGCGAPDQCTRYCNVCTGGASAAFDICYETCAAPIDRSLNWTYGADACERATSALRECAIRAGACGSAACQAEQDAASMQCQQSFGP